MTESKKSVKKSIDMSGFGCVGTIGAIFISLGVWKVWGGGFGLLAFGGTMLLLALIYAIAVMLVIGKVEL